MVLNNNCLLVNLTKLLISSFTFGF
uniref:Uncharacterized protein n=1 Tax=Rhizophora mucronata TaxID=61149 RepID=A0A2P2J008_RHIMU